MIRLRIDGDPRPKGSLRPGVSKTGKAFLRESSGENLALWRQTLHIYLSRVARGKPITGAVGVVCHFQIRRPRKPSTWWPTAKNRGDLDKFTRGVGDALTDARVIADDSQVVLQLATKSFGTPGVEICVFEMPEVFSNGRRPEFAALLIEALGVLDVSGEVVGQAVTAR